MLYQVSTDTSNLSCRIATINRQTRNSNALPQSFHTPQHIPATSSQRLKLSIAAPAKFDRVPVIPEHLLALCMKQRPNWPILPQVQLDRNQIMQLVGEHDCPGF